MVHKSWLSTFELTKNQLWTGGFLTTLMCSRNR